MTNNPENFLQSINDISLDKDVTYKRIYGWNQTNQL